MKYARIENGQLMVGALISDPTGQHDANAENPTIPVGWTLVEDTVTAEEIVNEFPVLSRRQLRLALLSLGVTTAAMEGVLASIVDLVEQESARIFWEDTVDFTRGHSLVTVIGSNLGMTDEQMDAAWMQAATEG